MPTHPKSFENKNGLSVTVKHGNIEAAIRTLGRKVKSEGILRELRMRQTYEKPCVKRNRKKNEAILRHRKAVAANKDI